MRPVLLTDKEAKPRSPLLCLVLTDCAEVNATVIHTVDGHGIAQNVHVAVFLRKPPAQRLPLIPACFASEDSQLSLHGEMLGVALDGHYKDGLRLVRMHIDDESKV